MVALTWHACKYKVHKLHQRYISQKLINIDRTESTHKGIN